MNAPDIARLPGPELLELLETGHPIDPSALDDSVYRGTSLGLPEWVVRLTWRHFEKVFHRDPATGELRGWNIRIKDRHSFGPFGVVSAHDHPVRGARVDHALLLDYSRGAAKSASPLRVVRDPLVAVTRGDTHLLLGRTYLQVLGRSLPTPSYFTLERLGPLPTSQARTF